MAAYWLAISATVDAAVRTLFLTTIAVPSSIDPNNSSSSNGSRMANSTAAIPCFEAEKRRQMGAGIHLRPIPSGLVNLVPDRIWWPFATSRIWLDPEGRDTHHQPLPVRQIGNPEAERAADH